MEVLPTPWSPKNTNLYFARGEILGPDVVTGAAAEDEAPFPSVDDIFIIEISWMLEMSFVLLTIHNFGCNDSLLRDRFLKQLKVVRDESYVISAKASNPLTLRANFSADS